MTGSMKFSIVAAYEVIFTLVPLTVNAAEVIGKKPRHVLGQPKFCPKRSSGYELN